MLSESYIRFFCIIEGSHNKWLLAIKIYNVDRRIKLAILFQKVWSDFTRIKGLYTLDIFSNKR